MNKISTLLTASLFCLNAMAGSPSKVQGHPESVLINQGAKYIAIVGDKLEPTVKDKDGRILKNGQSLTETGALNAPKGLLMHQGYLYCTDIDRIVKIDPSSGKILAELDLSEHGMVFMNDLESMDDDIVASCTDLNTIFLVDAELTKARPVKTNAKILGPNGLAWDSANKILYVCEYAQEQEKTIGQVKAIHMKTQEVRLIAELNGMLDGLALYQGKLYVSDWTQSGKQAAIRSINLADGTVKDVVNKNFEIQGPADFCITPQGTLCVPGMMNGEIYSFPLKK